MKRVSVAVTYPLLKDVSGGRRRVRHDIFPFMHGKSNYSVMKKMLMHKNNSSG